MQNKKLWLLICALVLLIILAIGLGAAFYWLVNRTPSIQPGTVLEVKLRGSVPELPVDDPFSMLFSSKRESIWDMRKLLNSAARDDRIGAVYLEVSPLLASWAQVEELRDLVKEFRASGKPLFTFLAVDVATEKEIYLASAGNHVTLNPTSGVLINGLMAEVTFMKGTMDKLGIKPQFVQMKEYKSPETYSRRRMTPEFRAMYQAILRDIQNRFVVAVAEDRGILQERLTELIDRGILTGGEALEEKLVDELDYRVGVQDQLRELVSPEDGTYQGISSRQYLRSLPSTGVRPKARIALVGALGTIVAGRNDAFRGIMGGSTVAARLREVRENRSIDGVILRVDSPGGSPVGSDMVWRETQRLEEAGKPVVASMSGVAGSGGYYVSMGARKVVSQPSTITGSIGVIFGKFDLTGLYNWLGMDVEQIKLSPNADLLSFHASLTPEQRALVEEWMLQTYEDFVRKAAESRNMSFEELEPKAHGKVYTGAQALEAGLVDELGGISTAIRLMKEELGLAPDDAIRLELFPKPKTLLEVLASGELFELRQRMDVLANLFEELKLLERPAAWLLMPEVSIQ